ncbi:competence/damage-inducible protein A [Oceanobacillus polygoni]|uniref:Putative competence-damage inducible protein n=1 Tax=Oceanobacillus polygoni TaxID=1235259 RepID=A0A9X1CC76_9BACI|nr:competence/damage-inducible protein A [Oceanobacillus polygoni]MBP2077726.1 nicotinamide-nucleotide amidase [Oceanobacillus polygoni]
MKQVKAEIVAVGTELLLGQIANTNAQWLSQQLAQYGINVYNHAVVGDNLDRVEEAFLQAQGRSDIIIVTGGLGPTDDDLTREAFQRISKLEMVEHQATIDKIEMYFKNHTSNMTPNNRKQARIFKGCTVLKNNAGMAPGMKVELEGKSWFFLPGVPREMKRITTDEIIPFLRNLTGDAQMIKSLVLKFIGIGESTLEHELKDLIIAQSNPTIAPLAQDDGVVIRLTAKGSSEKQLDELLGKTKEQILARVGDHFFGENDQTIEQVIVELLQSKNKKLAAAESLTGGMFTEKIISVSGASSVCPGGLVCYDTKVKQNILGVAEQTIQEEGTVSEACAAEMADQIRKKFDSQIGISFTGVAGPNEIEGQPVGKVYIAISDANGYKKVDSFLFTGARFSIRKRASIKGLEILFNYLKS